MTTSRLRSGFSQLTIQNFTAEAVKVSMLLPRIVISGGRRMVAQEVGKRRRARRETEPVEVRLKPKRRTTGSRVIPPKTSRTRKPEEMGLEEWQIALRREFGREQKYRLKNVGEHPVFSEFEVANQETQRTYRVAIRGNRLGDNYCSCPDFAVNTLGTCKHIEFTLTKLERTRGGKTAFKAGFHPEYSEIFVLYGARRSIAFRAGKTCPDELRKLAARSFDADGILKPGAESHLAPLVKRPRQLGHELRCYPDVWDFAAALSKVRYWSRGAWMAGVTHCSLASPCEQAS